MIISEEVGRHLVEACRNCPQGTEPWIFIEWKEPYRTDGGALDWKDFSAQGPVSDRFLAWLTAHYQFWRGQDGQVIPIAMIRVEANPDRWLPFGW